MVLRSRTQAGRWRGSLAPIRAPCSLEEIHELVLSVNIYALGAGREATAMMLGGVTGGRLPGGGTKLALTKVNGGGHSMTTVPRLEHVVHADILRRPPPIIPSSVGSPTLEWNPAPLAHTACVGGVPPPPPRLRFACTSSSATAVGRAMRYTCTWSMH